MQPITRSTTIRDVARLAGVSVATVSRVLNGNHGVRGPARQAVERAIKTLNFEPNQTARRLSLGKTFTLAAIAPFFYRASSVERLRGLESVFSTSAYDLVVYNVETIETRDRYFSELLRPDRVDGVVVISLSPDDAHAEAFERSGLPVVLVDAVHPRLPSVHEDSALGGYLATRHLIELGHRRIAFICDELNAPLSIIGSNANINRLAGYRRALSEAGLPLDPALFREGPHSKRLARGLARELLTSPNPPTAIFAVSDTHAMGVLDAARDLNLRVPGDLSVVGYDDVEVAEYIGLTTINQSLEKSGRRGAELLLGLLDTPVDAPTGESVQPGSESIEVTLVVRGTTGAPLQRG
ncbi:MAG: LacI family transcriptional regulator [Thermoflexales bacterium]|nr:LacI family transcriptional regulator [Thermoflexales bacterium]